ncbi:MAG: fumarylacetoacetate hydrolase family protein [Rhodospirillales bacterium]|nr:fumarylacetoacetate hydrolase family protein [Rhodospirillales bacterium]
MNFAPAKNFDTPLSLGPCVVVDELDAENVDFETLVNGQQRQVGNTKEMVFSFGEYLEYLSRDMTLFPGDIILSGTPAGTVADSTPVGGDGKQPDEPFLQIGDKVEIKSAAIGSLHARITAKS